MIEALTQLIADGGAWVGISGGKLEVTFHSFEMPEKEGEPSDIWRKNFDLLEMVMDWAGNHDGLPQLSDAQREDLEERTRGFEIECEEKEERIKERDELATQLEFLEAELDGVRAAEVRVNQSDYSPYDPTRSRVGRRFSRTRLDFFGLDGRLSSSSPFVARQPHDMPRHRI